MRGPNPFAFAPSGSGVWVAQQQRDRAVFQDSVMKIEDAESGETVALSTAYVGRSRNLWFGPAVEAVDDDGAIVVSRGGIVERYRSFRRATEQAWLFDEAPAGTGDLVVRTNVTGVTSADAVEQGLILHTSSADFLYENANWIDATGSNVKLVPTWTGASVEIVVPASVLASAAFPAILDPLIGPWTPTPTVTPGYLPAVASNGSGYLAVWEDYTNKSNASRILARRYDASGNVVDTTPIEIAPVAGSIVQGEPSVAYDGTSYVVAFWDNNNNKGRNRVKVAPVNPSTGAVGAITTFDSGNTKPSEYSPWIACAGGQCGVANHQTNNSKAQIYFTSYKWNAANSKASTHATLTITNGNTASYGANVATDGTNFFIVWEQGTVGSASVSAATVKIGASTDSVGASTVVTLVSAPTGGEAYAPAVTYTGASAKFIVVYSSYTAANGDDAMGRLVTASATSAPTVGAEKTIRGGSGDQDNVGVACAGGNCMATVWENDSIYAMPVDITTGAYSGSGGGTLNSSTTDARDNPRIAGNGSNFFAAWDDRRSGWYQARGTVVSTSGSASSDQLVSKP